MPVLALTAFIKLSEVEYDFFYWRSQGDRREIHDMAKTESKRIMRWADRSPRTVPTEPWPKGDLPTLSAQGSSAISVDHRTISPTAFNHKPLPHMSLKPKCTFSQWSEKSQLII